MIFRKNERGQNSILDNLILELINQACSNMEKNKREDAKSLLYQAHIIYEYRGYTLDIESEINDAILELMKKYS